MTMSSGLRSPPLPRSSAASPRPNFDRDLLTTYMKKLISTTFEKKDWSEAKERKIWIKEINERVKERMLGIQPHGFKYVVLTQIHENRGQGCRADIVCQWDSDTDIIAQEMYINDDLICICIALAIA